MRLTNYKWFSCKAPSFYFRLLSLHRLPRTGLRAPRRMIASRIANVRAAARMLRVGLQLGTFVKCSNRLCVGIENLENVVGGVVQHEPFDRFAADSAVKLRGKSDRRTLQRERHAVVRSGECDSKSL